MRPHRDRRGLAAGENVVTDGVDRLRDGAAIRLAGARRRAATPDGGEPVRRRQHRRGAPENRRSEGAHVNPSRLFIERPVATSLLMFAILLVGIVAYRFLPLSALPEVDYPTIQVQTFYPGASPEVMTSSVTAPLERQFGQMPSLSQMMSQSSGRRLASSRCASGSTSASTSPSRRCRRRSMRRAICCPPTCRRRRSTPRSTRPTRRS